MKRHSPEDNPTLPLSRRKFLAGSAALLGAQAMAAERAATGAGGTMELATTVEGEFELTPLPYAEDALEPHISGKTMSFHYGKHHKGYVEKLNKAILEKKLPATTLTKLIADTAKDPALSGVFNNAAQTWNHTFYWSSMKPKGGGEPTGKLAEKIKSDLGGYAAFRKAFEEAANAQFGSGWAWLSMKDGKLEVTKTANADTPIAHGVMPLLVIDVWEHAYYLDYQNKRANYVTAFLDHLVNWEFAASVMG